MVGMIGFDYGTAAGTGARKRPGLFIGLFGKPRFAYDEQAWRFVAPPRTLPLLAYLVLHRGKAVAREAAAFALWPDETESDARSNLRRHLHYLQNALPPSEPDCPWVLAHGRTTLQWNVRARCRVDVAEFERSGEDAKALAQAVDLYAGDLLEDALDEWLVYDRERLRNLQIRYLERLSDSARSDGEFARALSYAQRLLAMDAVREDTIRQVMELRYAMGDRSGALSEFEQFAKRLRAVLDVEPMAETRACYESILRNAPVTRSAGEMSAQTENARQRWMLPFVGRETELDQLRTWWTRAARGSGSVGLIGGEAGIGKTRLLSEFSRLVTAEGGRVLQGGATVNEAVPYEPFIQALRNALPLIASAKIEGIWLSVLATLIPELRDRCPNLQPPAQVGAAQERGRLFEALVQVVGALAQRTADVARSRGPALGRFRDDRLLGISLAPHKCDAADRAGIVSRRRGGSAASASKAAPRAGARSALVPCDSWAGLRVRGRSSW